VRQNTLPNKPRTQPRKLPKKEEEKMASRCTKCGSWGHPTPCPKCEERSRNFEESCEDPNSGEFYLSYQIDSPPSDRYATGWASVTGIYKVAIHGVGEVFLVPWKSYGGDRSWKEVSSVDLSPPFKEVHGKPNLRRVGKLSEGYEKILVTTSLEVQGRG
jgi:hypothetical protein